MTRQSQTTVCSQSLISSLNFGLTVVKSAFCAIFFIAVCLSLSSTTVWADAITEWNAWTNGNLDLSGNVNFSDGATVRTLTGAASLTGTTTVAEEVTVPLYTVDGTKDGTKTQIINTSSALTLENVAIKNGGKNSSNLSAIYCNNKITITGVNKFTDNTGYDGGVMTGTGGVEIDGTNYFANNTATDRAGVIWCSNHDIVINGSATFFNNQCNNVDGGAVAVFTGIVKISGTTFEKNSTKVNGGAICAAGQAELTGSNIFTGNECGANGAGISSTDAGLVSCITISGTGKNTFTKNIAAGAGGALYLHRDVKIQEDAECIFKENEAASGAAIYAADIIISTSKTTSFESNTATTNGGAIYLRNNYLTTRNVTLNGTNEFKTNHAINGGGGAIYSTRKLTIEGTSTFNGNTAGATDDDGNIISNGDGGAIFSEGNLTLSGTGTISFTGNKSIRDTTSGL